MLNLVNQRAVLEPTREAVLSLPGPHGLGRQDLFNAELILEEVLINQISHAFTDGAPHRVELTVQAECDEIMKRLDA